MYATEHGVQGNLFVGSMMEGRIPGTGHLERIVLYVLTEENNGALLRLEPVAD